MHYMVGRDICNGCGILCYSYSLLSIHKLHLVYGSKFPLPLVTRIALDRHGTTQIQFVVVLIKDFARPSSRRRDDRS